MPRTVTVRVPDAEYDVVIGAGLLGEVGRMIRQVTDAKRIALVTDFNVGELFGIGVDTSLARAEFLVSALQIPPGEASKNWTVAGQLLEAFANEGLGREDCVVALGGGVVGDIAGFCAATYLRGIDFIQIPTTLLAQVDSSVGGKTGVDLAAGKNLAGAFKQPKLVIADTDTLGGLPESEWLSGLAEVAKSAVIDGEGFLGWMEAHAEALSKREPEVVAQAVERCVEFKASVVARDEREEGPRECLNYGHTLGHALEKALGYGTVSHGAAVAEGMRFAVRVASDVGRADKAFVKRQDKLLDALGLDALDVVADGIDLLDAMHADKKSRSGVVRMVLADAPGEWACVKVDDADISTHLALWAKTKLEKGA